MDLNKTCILFFCSLFSNLLIFSKAIADFDDLSNKTLEKRLHSIYTNHYSRPVLDSDWFKILEGTEVQSHSVQAGDTLWSISAVYFGDGNYWSKLWSVNKNITNPHLIFVNDVIHFHTGTFEKPPGIEVEKNSENIITSEETISEPSPQLEDSAVAGNELPKVVKIPDSFKKSFIAEKKKELPVVFVPRPKIKFLSEFNLTEDLLNQPPEIVGSVRSLGRSRMVTAEGSIIILQSTTDLIADQTYSVIKREVNNVDGGYPVHVLAIVKVQRKIDENMYEGMVLNQFESIETNSPLSTYKVRTVSSDIVSRSAKEVPLKVLKEKKTLWSTGDTLFFRTLDGGAVELGDVIKINNKYADDIEFYISNGYIKVVSVYPPYATGVVVTSREHIRDNSVSRPTYTGWSVW